MRNKSCLALIALSSAAWASHDADDRQLNGYELTFASPSSRQIDGMSSRLYEAPGTAPEIIGKAQACVAKYVSNEPQTSNGVLGVIGAKGKHSSSSEPEHPVLESADPANGVLIAHSRAQYHHLLLAFESRSKFSVEAKDGRFKIVQSDLAYRQLDTGNDASQDFSPIQRLAVTGWDDALEALQEVSDQVAKCTQGIDNAPASTDD